MSDFEIITDSCCDLSRDYMEENKVPYASLTCVINDKEYKDDFGKSLRYDEFYNAMREGKVPKTSQPSVDSFYNVFKNIVSEGKDIIYICVSSGLSGTYNSANIAKNMIVENYKDSKIEIVDILTASLGQGLMVIKARKMKKNGSTFEEIICFLEEYKWKLNTYITVDDLIHLKRGGRISSAAAFVGIVLHIKPVITINNEGKVIPVVKAKGRKNSIKKLAEIVCEKFDKNIGEDIYISHGDALEEALKLKELIIEKCGAVNVNINFIGPVVGTYGGPGALAVFFFGAHRQNHIIEK